jgi:hypothetical protein
MNAFKRHFDGTYTYPTTTAEHNRRKQNKKEPAYDSFFDYAKDALSLHRVTCKVYEKPDQTVPFGSVKYVAKNATGLFLDCFGDDDEEDEHDKADRVRTLVEDTLLECTCRAFRDSGYCCSHVAAYLHLTGMYWKTIIRQYDGSIITVYYNTI